MEHVFYVPGSAWAVGYAVEQDGRIVEQFTGKTLDELQASYPGAVLGTVESFNVALEEKLRSEPEPITEEQWFDALEALPPQEWRGDRSAESFKFLERQAGRVTSIYARVGVTFWRFHDICTIPHAEIIAKVEKQAAENQEAPANQ